MIKSMTAFGRAVAKSETRDITVELRSVNSRYFDCTVRLPRTHTYLEDKIKTFVQQNAVSRAKVDVTVTLERHGGEQGKLQLDTNLAAAYIDALYRLRDNFQLSDDISVMRVAENRDLFTYTQEETDDEAEWICVRSVLADAIEDYKAMRTAEGEKMEADIREKLARVAALAENVREISRTDVVGYRDKLEARLRALLAEHDVVPDEARLLTECAVFADKIAIDEELVRLASHFSAFDEICRAGEPAGRKLDFLMQEMNRETNTIGSKANNARIAHLVVDMKCELEKIREQIQNIE